MLQVGSISNERSSGSGSGGPKINGSDRIRLLIPDFQECWEEKPPDPMKKVPDPASKKSTDPDPRPSR